MAASGGGLTLIHRADRLAEILGALEGRFGALAVRPLYPREGMPATRILVSGRRDSRAPLAILPGLVLHRPEGGFTARAEAILRAGQGLDPQEQALP